MQSTTIQRRTFTGLMLGLAIAVDANAQKAAPVEGTNYIRLARPLPALPGGKIEVIEFFWYGCPHCNAFEPALEAWVKQLPADVVFHRVPVAFREEPFGAHQRIYYSLESMGLLDKMHAKVFSAIHNDHLRLDKPEDIEQFMRANGVDSAKFMTIYNSFAVQTKQRQAVTLSDSYKIDGVPALGINGQYFTSGTLAGSPEQSLQVADYLIDRSRHK